MQVKVVMKRAAAVGLTSLVLMMPLLLSYQIPGALADSNGCRNEDFLIFYTSKDSSTSIATENIGDEDSLIDGKTFQMLMLDEAAKSARRSCVSIVDVVGHTDQDGDEAANMRVGLRKAQDVRDELVKRGVRLSIIRTSSKGEEEGAAKGDPLKEPQNRHVRVSVR